MNKIKKKLNFFNVSRGPRTARVGNRPVPIGPWIPDREYTSYKNSFFILIKTYQKFSIINDQKGHRGAGWAQ